MLCRLYRRSLNSIDKGYAIKGLVICWIAYYSRCTTNPSCETGNNKLVVRTLIDATRDRDLKLALTDQTLMVPFLDPVAIMSELNRVVIAEIQ